MIEPSEVEPSADYVTDVPRVLVVDDEPANLLAMEAVLESLGHVVVPASSGRAALALLLQQDFAVILLDLRMPILGGLETARLIREHPRFVGIPILFLTANSQTPLEILEGYAHGAVDILVKPFAPEILRSKVAIFVELYAQRSELKRQSALLLQHQLRTHGEREQRTAEVALAAAQLREAQKLEAVGRLAAGVAHDFNNMLSVVLAVSDLLLLEGELSPMATSDVRDIHDAAVRAATLTQQLVAFSRRQVLEPQIVDLDQIVLEMKRMLERLVGPRIELRCTVRSDIPAIEADPAQVHQVILNMVVNARDAMPEGGKLTIETDEVDVDDVVAGRRRGKHVVLRVIDSGVGMSEATRERLFEPFFTTKERGKGTGLGLATAYGVVHQSGGYITVDTALGRGSTFSVFFPSVDRARTEAEPISSGAPSQLRGQERVIVVDDEPLVRRSVARILRVNGYDVAEAESVEHARELAKDLAVKLIVTDVMMPRVSGIELAQQLRIARPELRVLFMSALGETEIGSAPRTGFVLKPFRAETLLREMRDVLEDA